MKNLFFTILAVLCFHLTLVAQEEEKDVDASKPTNLYTQVNANLESSFSKGQNLYGMRFNVRYAFNPDNLVLAEVPFMHNDRTNKFGVSDARLRYFSVVKRNISKKFIAIAPFTDITVPTGSFENGLGTSSWSIAVGNVFGFVLTPKLAIFPGISYVHVTKPSTNLIPDELKFSGNGIGLQFNASYSFSKRTFLFINPSPIFMNTNSTWKAVWWGEFNLNHVFVPNKFLANIFWGPNFTNEINVIRLGATFFL
ncbi:hypothetical protein VOI54_03580 [Tamlana sp. 2201CG12-4]|uniref:hypothetical protein n=1 Tax=Tamlana sp. 2201CG12-4 TaxID=3112582 RepID=UPI002DBE779F|nr:hypothetical protein [Tamlana sp. 2201CG12-4]MEC3906083.1 hypothetical protein [Tamlana sp. 2201CG12-4]